MKPIRDIGEDALVRRLIRLVPLDPSPLAGPGDDCAVIDPGPGSATLQLLKTDAMVAGIHFLPDSPPRAVGWKAAARVVSDFAAMGGRPERFLVTLALDPQTSVSWAEELYRGIGDCLAAFHAVLAGGETSSIPTGSAAVISIAATGSVLRDQRVLRSTGRPGQALFVTGTLGGSLRQKHLSFIPRIKEADWLVSKYKPTAMMDVSDGLAKDLPRLAAASGCGYELDKESLPITPGCTLAQALGDGEDFELLFACEQALAVPMLAAWGAMFLNTPLTRIGRLVMSGRGETLAGGWDHFGPQIS